MDAHTIHFVFNALYQKMKDDPGSTVVRSTARISDSRIRRRIQALMLDQSRKLHGSLPQ